MAFARVLVLKRPSTWQRLASVRRRACGRQTPRGSPSGQRTGLPSICPSRDQRGLQSKAAQCSVLPALWLERQERAHIRMFVCNLVRRTVSPAWQPGTRLSPVAVRHEYCAFVCRQVAAWVMAPRSFADHGRSFYSLKLQFYPRACRHDDPNLPLFPPYFVAFAPRAVKESLASLPPRPILSASRFRFRGPLRKRFSHL
jgi:hypothetical protein